LYSYEDSASSVAASDNIFSEKKNNVIKRKVLNMFGCFQFILYCTASYSQFSACCGLSALVSEQNNQSEVNSHF